MSEKMFQTRTPVDPKINELLAKAIAEYDALPNAEKAQQEALASIHMMLGLMTDESRPIFIGKLINMLHDLESEPWHRVMRSVAALTEENKSNLIEKLREKLEQIKEQNEDI